MRKYKFINYKDKKILYLNFTGLEVNEAHEYLENSRSFIMNQKPASILLLINAAKVQVESELLETFKKPAIKILKSYAKSCAPYVIASAIILPPKLANIIANAQTQSSKDKFVLFEDVEQAKEWLSKQ